MLGFVMEAPHSNIADRSVIFVWQDVKLRRVTLPAVKSELLVLVRLDFLRMRSLSVFFSNRKIKTATTRN